MKPLVYRELAVEDTIEAVQFLSEFNLAAVDSFLQELERAVERLRLNPRIGRTHPQVSDAAARVWRFGDWLLIYFDEEERIEVARIVHARRDLRGLLTRRQP